MTEIMKCFLCKNSHAEEGTTTYMTSCDSCYIIIKNVPCLRCKQCGEEYINGVTLQKIKSIIAKMRDALTEIAIVDFKRAA